MSVKTTWLWRAVCAYVCVFGCLHMYMRVWMCVRVWVQGWGGSVPPHFLFPSLSVVSLSPPLPSPHQLSRAGPKEGEKVFPSYLSPAAELFGPSFSCFVLLIRPRYCLICFSTGGDTCFFVPSGSKIILLGNLKKTTTKKIAQYPFAST